MGVCCWKSCRPGNCPQCKPPNNIDIKMGYAPCAVEWFAECAANYGAESVFVVSHVQSRRLRELRVDFLFAQDGLLHAAGIPRASLVWTESRSAKCRPFVQNDLTHFTDDQVEVLISIRSACWERRHAARPPPALLLVPTAWARGKCSDFGWTCSDAARASAGWSAAWPIYPQRTVGKSSWLGSSVEWRRGGRAGNCCCGAFPLQPNH